MNIIVLRSDGSIQTRPDTSLVRFPKDFYMPDEFTSLSAVTCTYIKLIKAGKAVPERFASRYFDSMGKGILIYCDGTEPYVDASSYFFEERVPAANLTPEQIRDICRNIGRITSRVSVRFSDIIAFENSGGTMLKRGDRVNLYSDDLAFNIF